MSTSRLLCAHLWLLQPKHKLTDKERYHLNLTIINFSFMIVHLPKSLQNFQSQKLFANLINTLLIHRICLQGLLYNKNWSLLCIHWYCNFKIPTSLFCLNHNLNSAITSKPPVPSLSQIKILFTPRATMGFRPHNGSLWHLMKWKPHNLQKISLAPSLTWIKVIASQLRSSSLNSQIS